MNAWIRPLAILFVIPVIAVVFFSYAPGRLNTQVKEDFLKGVEQATGMDQASREGNLKFINSLDLVKTCKATDVESQQLVHQLEVTDVCDSFQYFEWAQNVGRIIVLLGILQILISVILSQRAKKSRQALISSFRLGWSLSTALALLILLGQTALMAFLSYEGTVLFTGKYYPKLIGIVVILGAVALYKIVKLIFTKIPINSVEQATVHVSEKEAPKLWQTVREVAKKLQTTPPDQILVGISTPFYVTEFPVTYQSGTTSGKTLFLSGPLMKKLSLEEITAIIGHELGHFKGEDTLFTQEMTPMLIKFDTMMHHLLGSIAVSFPAYHILGVFRHAFETIIAEFRREREFLADICGGTVAGKPAMASALSRYVYHSEIYELALHVHLRKKIPLEESLASAEVDLAKDTSFWTQVSEQKTPHPFDSHPPLALRIEKLGEKLENMKHVLNVTPETSAHAYFFEGKAILASAEKEHAAMIEEAQERISLTASATESADAKALIEKHFPKKEYASSLSMMIVISCFIAFFTLGLPAILWQGANFAWQASIVAVVIIGNFFLFRYIQNTKGSKLTLTADGLQISAWKRPLRFEEIKQMNAVSNNGILQLTISFNEKIDPKDLFLRPIFPFRRPSVMINASGYQIKGELLLKDIYRYYQREADPTL